MLLKDNSLDMISDLVLREFDRSVHTTDFLSDLEAYTTNTLVTKDFDISVFVRLMQGIEMDFDQLYEGYIGKNVLNFFRQDHGYQDGRYRKQWGDKEDNEHLIAIMAQLDSTAGSFKDDLYRRMESTYESYGQ
jgi:hypothetical protein